ncbi:MAG: hypothetical protein V1690_00540 [Candidatus Moraniibacteriota bacterium]
MSIENKDSTPQSEQESEYRALTVKSVRETNPPGDSLLIDFEDSAISFELKKDYLAEHGLSSIAEGNVIKVKGKEGNDDAGLWGMAKIEDIKKAE